MEDNSYLGSINNGVNSGVDSYSQNKQLYKNKKNTDDDVSSPMEDAISKRMKKIADNNSYSDYNDVSPYAERGAGPKISTS